MTEQIRELQQQLRANPDDRELFDELADHFAETGDWRRLRRHYEQFAKSENGAEDFDQLVFVLEELAEATEDNKENSAILVALGDIYLDYVGDRDAGMSAYQKAFKTYPEDTTSLDRARRIYRESEDFDRVILLYNLERKVAREPSDESMALARMAQVHGDFLGDQDKALELLDQARELHPKNNIAQTVAAIYKAGGTVESAVKDRVREAHEAAAQGEDELAAVMMMDGAVLERFREGSDLREAVSLAEKAREFDPDNSRAIRFLEHAYAELDRADELERLSKDVEARARESARDADDADEAENPAEDAEEAEDEEAEDEEADAEQEESGEGDVSGDDAVDEPEQADDGSDAGAGATFDGGLEEAKSVLAEDPEDLEALDVVRADLRERGDWEQLVEVLEQSLKRLRKKEGELGVMVELANVHWRELGDLERAEYYFKRVKLLDSEQPDMLEFYEDYYQREEEWRKLYSLLSGQLDHVDSREEAYDLTERLGRIAEVQMESPEKAIDVWKTYTKEYEGDEQARENLRRLYEDYEKWNALVDFLKDEVKRLEEDDEDTTGREIELLERISEIYRDELGLDVMVINTLQAILELDPGHERAFEQLREKLEDNRRWNDLAQLLTDRADDAAEQGDIDSAVTYLLDVADIWQESLRNVTQAIPHLERIVEIAPERADVRDRLREIYEQRRDYESLFDLRYNEALLESGAAREEQFEELAELAKDRLNDPDRSVKVLEQLLELRPADEELIDKLEFIHRRRDSWGPLADILEKKADLVDGQDELELRRESASIRLEHLDDRGEAARAWRDVLDLAPDDEDALDQLTRVELDRESFDSLQDIYAERDALGHLYELMMERAEARDDVDARRTLLRRAAELARGELDDYERAAASLEALREASEEPLAIAAELEQVYEKTGNLEKQVAMNQLLLEAAEDDRDRIERLENIAELEGRRDAHADALEWQLQAVALDPENASAVDRAERYARKGEALNLLVENLEIISDSQEDDQVQERMWQRLGRIMRDDFDDYSASIEYFERLRERHPADLDTLLALDGLYDAIGDPDKRIEVLREQIDVLSDEGAEREDLVDQLSKIADVQREYLDEIDAARDTYNEILDIEPDHVPALRGMRQLYREDERWDEVVDSLLRELNLLGLDEQDRRTQAHMELADVYRVELGELSEAIHYYGQVLSEEPKHAGAVEAVEELLSEDEIAREAALMLEPIFRDTERPEQLAKALEARRRVASDRFEEQEILEELIPIHAEQLEDIERAFELARRQFDLDPGREEVWLRVEQLGAKLDRWEEIEEVFSEHAREEDSLGASGLNLLRHLASIREHRLGKKEEALAAWERLHENDPTDDSVIDALERLYRQMEQPGDLADTLEKKADLVDNDESRIELLEEAAMLREDVLDDEVGAINDWERVLELENDRQNAVEALERLFRRREAWADLDELYARQADLAMDPDRRRIYLLRLGKLRAEALDDYIGATELLSQLVTEDPGDDEALEAIEGLEQELEDSAERPELRVDIARTLEPVYRSRQDAESLARVLEVRVDDLMDPFEQLGVLDELIDIYDQRLDAPDRAFETLQRTVPIDADDPGRRERLIEMGQKLERLEDAADALADAAVEADPLEAPAIYRRIGQLFDEKLQEPSRAIEFYEQAVEVQPDDERALEALEALYQNTSNFEMLAENLRQQVRVGEPSRQADLLERLGTIHEEVLEQPEEAIDAYHELLDVNPESSAAFESLERLYEKLERWIDLSDILRRRAGATFEEDERVETLERLAVVYEEKLDDIVEAINVYNEILSSQPDHVGAITSLERLYREDARWNDLADILRQKLMSPAVETDADRNETELELAEVLRGELFEVEQALDLYRSVLARSPGNERAVEALEELAEDENWAPQIEQDLQEYYSSQRKWDDLVDLYEMRSEQSYDPAEKSEYIEKVASVYRDGLNDRSDALDALARSWKLDPSRESVLEQFQSLVQVEGAWAQLADVYEDVLTELSDPQRMLELRLELGELYRERLDDEAEAERHYREALNIDDRNLQAYGALQDIYVGGEQWHELIELLERRFNATVGEDPDAAVDLLQTVATLQEDQLDDPYSAVDTHQRVLDIEPDESESAEALRRLFREQERWDDLSDLLRQQVSMSADPDRSLELKFELGDVLRAQLSRPIDALDIYREILGVEPGHGPTVASLEEMFESTDELRPDIAELLEPIYRSDANWSGLVSMLRARAEFEQGQAAVPYLEEAARIAEGELEDPLLSYEIYKQLVHRHPSDASARMSMRRQAGRKGDWQEVVETYEHVLTESFEVDDFLRSELLVEKGRVYEERLEDLVEASAAYREALVYDVESAEAVDSLDRVLTRQEAWLDLADLYRDRADVVGDPHDSKEWLEKLATLYEEVLDQLDDAIDIYIRVLDLEPDDTRIQRTLERLYGHAHRWHDLADLYRQRIEHTLEPQVAMDLRFKLAALLEGELDLVDDALQIYRDILDSEPGHYETLRALEGLRRDLAAREGDWVQYRLQILDLLLDHYNEQQHWRRIVDLLDEKEELLSDIGGQVQALSEMADVIQRASSDETEKVQAVMKLARGVCIEPSNEQLRERVAERAEQLDAWERVIPIYLQGLESTDDPHVQSEILITVAQAYRQHLDDAESAIAAYQLAVDITGNEQALSKLQQLYAELEAWKPLVDVLEKRLENEYDGEARAGLLNRIGMIHDDVLHQSEKALDAYEELHEDDPADLAVIETLERLYEETERWADLEELLRSKAELLEDEDERLETLRKLAEVQDSHLGDETAAIATYQEVVDRDEEAIGAVRALTRLFEAEERWPELLDNLQIEKDFAGGLDELNELELRMGNILLEKLDAPVDAYDHYSAVAERSPTLPQAQTGLMRLLQRPETREDAAKALQSIYRELEDWDALQGLYEEQLEFAEDPDRRGELYMELAQLQDEQFDNRQMAFITLGRALREIPQITFIRHELERLSRGLENVDELVAVYEDTLEGDVHDPMVEMELHRRLGEIYADELEATEPAIDHLEQALAIDEYDTDTLDLLDRLYQQEHQWPDLAEVLRTRLVATDPDEINDVRFRLGYLHEVMFEDRLEAFDLYRQIVMEEPQHGGALEGLGRMVEETDLRRDIVDLLEPIYRDMEEWSNLAHLLELKLEIVDTDAERADINRQLADIYLERLDSVHQGYAHLGRALRADPFDADVQGRLEELGDEHEMHEQLVALYEEVIEDLDDPVRLVELAERAAQWALAILDDSDRASELYRLVLDIEPEHERALDALETIARREDRPIDLEKVLAKKADVAFDPDKRRQTLVELGEVRTRLENFDDAIAAYEEALTLDEGDAEVMNELVGLFEITERYDDLVGIIDRLAQFEEDPDKRKLFYVRIGQYERQFLDRPHEAVEAYQRALDMDQDDMGVIRSLEELYEETEQWQKLSDMVERQLDDPEALSESELVRLYVQRAKVNYEQFNDVDSAIADYQRAFELQDDSQLVVDALDELYRAEGRWEDLVELYTHQMQIAGEEDRLVDLHVKMANIHHEHLGDEQRAVELLDTVLDLRPHHMGALEVQEVIYAGRNEWEQVLDVIERKIEAVDDTSEKVALLLEKASVCQNAVGDADRAADAYLRILELEPTHEEAISSLEELYREMEAYGELYAIYEHKSAYAEDDEEQVDILLDMAELAEGKLGSAELRTDALKAAYDLRGADLSIVEPLLDAYIDAGQFEEAEPLLESTIEQLRDDRQMSDVVRFEHLRGKLAERQGDLAAAREAYESAHKVDATYIPNLLSLGKLEVAQESWDDALKIFQTLLLHQMSIENSEDKVELYYNLGLVRQNLGDERRAKDMFNRALGIDSGHEPSKEALAAL
ncbi:MAG: hypothetical protein ACQEVA_08665 [Myxococcota bacterium]